MEMAKRVVHMVTKEEELIICSDNNPLMARCTHLYCPSSIQIPSININGEKYYYLSYIPHLHKNTLYQGNMQCLPRFIQLTLYYQSGWDYFSQQISQFANSSQSTNFTFHYQLLENKKSIFMMNWQYILHQSALNDFGNDFYSDSIINNIINSNNWVAILFVLSF